MQVTEPTYTADEIMERIELFEREDLSILVKLLNEEKKRYSLVDLQKLNIAISMRYGEIRIAEEKK